MNEVSRFKWQGIDLTFDNLDMDNTAEKYKHLCPYGASTIKQAFSFEAMKYRIKLIDSAILRHMSV